MSSVLRLSESLCRAIEHEALAAYPRECCGLIEGMRSGEELNVTAIHPVRNLAREIDRFELDPAEHFRLLRALRGTGRAILGCYHSHPNGSAELSARDRENGGEEEFIWVVLGITADAVTGWSASEFAGGEWRDIDFIVSAREPACA